MIGGFVHNNNAIAERDCSGDFKGLLFAPGEQRDFIIHVDSVPQPEVMDYFCAGFPNLFLVKEGHTKEAFCRLSTEEIVASNGQVVAYPDRLLDAFQSQIDGFLRMELRDLSPSK